MATWIELDDPTWVTIPLVDGFGDPTFLQIGAGEKVELVIPIQIEDNRVRVEPIAVEVS